MIQGWAESDPYAVSELLASGAEIPGDRDLAAGVLALSIAERDPHAALQWVGTMRDGPDRQSAAESVARSFLQRENAGMMHEADAQAALQSTGLPAERIAAIREELFPTPDPNDPFGF